MTTFRMARGRCNPYAGWNGGPCGPAPCQGECSPETPVCVSCDFSGRKVPAVLVTHDFEYLCEDCGYEMQPESFRYLYDD